MMCLFMWNITYYLDVENLFFRCCCFLVLIHQWKLQRYEKNRPLNNKFVNKNDIKLKRTNVCICFCFVQIKTNACFTRVSVATSRCASTLLDPTSVFVRPDSNREASLPVTVSKTKRKTKFDFHIHAKCPTVIKWQKSQNETKWTFQGLQFAFVEKCIQYVFNRSFI